MDKGVKILISVVFVLMILMPIVLAQTAQDIYDINDRQTKQITAYIDAKVSTMSDDMKKFTDDLFKTFDTRMNLLTKNFAVQSAIMIFCAVLGAELISILIRQGHERKLIDFRYKILLQKEIELTKREYDLKLVSLSLLKPVETQVLPSKRGRPIKGGGISQTQTEPVQTQTNPLPPPPVPPKPKSGFLGVFKDTKSKKTKEEKELERVLRGVK